MHNLQKKAAAVALSLFVMGFDMNDAGTWINGEWEGRTIPWSLSVDLKAGTGIFIDGGRRVSGAFSIDEVVAKSARFHVGAQQFTIHFQSRESARLSVGEGSDFSIEKVR
jgi:hypothetical protein